MKFIKYLISSVIFVFILHYATPAYAAMTPVTTPFQITDMVLYDVNNTTTKNLSDYSGTSKVIILGRAVSCLNTDATIKNAEALAKGMDTSKVTFIFGDYDDSVTKTKSYTDVHNIIMCASPTNNYYYANYTWQRFWECTSPDSPMSITLPLVMVVDKRGLVKYYSNGITNTKDIYEALKAVNGGDLTFDDEKACTTEIAKSNLAKHKLYRTDDIALSYYKVVYDQQYYTSGVGTRITDAPISIGTSALKLATGNQINAASTTVSQDDRIKAIKALSASIVSGKTTDYDKVLAIHNWVCDNIYYDYMYYYGFTDSTNLSAYDVMTNKTTVCEGYANLTTMLVRAAGIPCKKIVGYGLNYGNWPANLMKDNLANHAWNEAYINGKWIIIDNTWDSGNTYYNNVLTKGMTGYSYFDPFIATFSSDHYVAEAEEGVIDNKAPVLSTSSTGSNFVELTWKEINNAYGYDIYRDSGTGKYEKICTTYQSLYNGTVIYKDKTCSANTQYSYKVIPYCNSGTTPIYGLTSNSITAKTTQPQQQITATTNYTKKMGDAAFLLNATTSGDGQLTYSSSDTKILSVDGMGKVTIAGAGTAKITITAAATTQYAQNTLVVTVVVNKGTQSIDVPYYFAKTYGDSEFSLGVTVTQGGGALSYISDNSSIVTVSSTGLVTIKGCGDTKITITAEANTNYYGVSTYAYISVKKISPKFNVPSYYYSKTYGDSPVALGITTTGNGQLSYTSSNKNAVTVDSTGKVTIVGAGSAAITVTTSETATYSSSTMFVSFYVNKAKQSIAATASSYTKTYGDTSFALGATTSGNGQLSYTSSNQNVASVDASGKVTIVGVGTAIITITASETTTYAKATALVSVYVKKAAQKVSASAQKYSKTFGDVAFSLGVTRTGNGLLSYTSSNQNVALVDASGKVTIVGAGSATITILAAEAENYVKATTTVTISVKKGTQKITATTSYTKTFGNSAFSLAATVTKGGSKLNYLTSDSSVVTVSPAGLVTIKGCGKAVITITANENSNYNKATQTIQITINPKIAKITSLVSTTTAKMNLSWEADTSSSGYEIVYSMDKNFKSNKVVVVSNNATKSMVISGLQKGKVYYVKIRAYKTVSGSKLYGEYSSVKNVKVK